MTKGQPQRIIGLYETNEMVELKKTLFIWAPLTLVLCGSASYLGLTDPYVSHVEHSSPSTLTIPARTQHAESQASLIYQGAKHP